MNITKLRRRTVQTHTHTHVLPDELSRHGSVVQVEFDDVVTLELL